jgi:hypothetical protein
VTCHLVDPRTAWRRAALGLLLVAACSGAASTGDSAATPHPALQALPATLVWAWERPEDLRWLPAQVGVAYVSTRVWLSGAQASVRPRANPLRVAPGTALVPVVHVDASTRQPPQLNPEQQASLVAQLLLAAQHAPQQVVQLDFEVRQSQRAFFTAVVQAARQALPQQVALSVTALASWCAGDHWLAGLPADEIVPMAFRMSRDSAVLRRHLAAHGRFNGQGCSQAVGTATDEPLPAWQRPAGVRAYVFSPRPWTATDWRHHLAAMPPPPVPDR